MIPDISELRDEVEELDNRIEQVGSEDGDSGEEVFLACPICFNKLRDSPDGDFWSCQGTGRNYSFLGLSEVCGCRTETAFRVGFGSRKVVQVVKY